MARFHAAGDLRLEEAPEPVPGPGDLVVRVQVAAAAGCGRCRDCAAGMMNMCPDLRAFGYDLDGGFAG